MNIVIVGHVDHGKSTVIGRLMADTGSLPEGKLDQVKAHCKRHARPFEYAFLLDALKDEQSQGITIDSARCFFKTALRHYIIIDAPGHIEFLKNMVTGAARAEAAVLIIDAHEGIQENSHRHGYLLSMLGLKQVIVCINKMDLIDHSSEIFDTIKTNYSAFLKRLDIIPQAVIPISAREGENITDKSSRMPWYKGRPLLESIDLLKKEKQKHKLPFRFPLQDIYKFTASGDNRRLFVGRVETGSIEKGSRVVFLPSGKESTIDCVAGFNIKKTHTASCGESTAFLLKEQIYVKPGELMCKANDENLPQSSSCFLTHIFWLGNDPMIMGKTYQFKLGTLSTPVELVKINHILDASTLKFLDNKTTIDRHDVAQCVLKTSEKIAFDLTKNMASTSRFVLVDTYKISGGGIILESLKDAPSSVPKNLFSEGSVSWDSSRISSKDRRALLGHPAGIILITGTLDKETSAFAHELEKALFDSKIKTYFLGVSSSKDGDISFDSKSRKPILESILSRVALLTESGTIVLMHFPKIDDKELSLFLKHSCSSNIFLIERGRSPLSPKNVHHTLVKENTNRAAISELLEDLDHFFEFSSHTTHG